jgi:uncharacterized membrane protein
MHAAKLWPIADLELEDDLQRMMILEIQIELLVAIMKKKMKKRYKINLKQHSIIKHVPTHFTSSYLTWLLHRLDKQLN